MKKYVIGISIIIFLSGCTRINEHEPKYVPEAGFSNRVMTAGCNYAYWKETLIFGDFVYKLDNGAYKKTGDSIYDLFRVDEIRIYDDIKQYNNLVVAVAEDMDKFLVYDMNSQTICVYDIYGQGNKAMYTWYVYNGEIYYMVESDIDILDRRLVRMDMATGNNEEIYFPTQLLLADFAMRGDGTIMAEVYNRDTKEMEYTRISIEKDGEISEKKLWVTDKYLYSYVLQYNKYGFFLLGEYPTVENGEKTEIICIKDNEDVQKINILSIYGLIITDTGYFICGNSMDESVIEDINDLISGEFDSIFFCNFDGEIIEKFYLDSEEYNKKGYKLKTMIYMDNEMIIVYLNDNKDLKIKNFLLR